jgi:hypothetical protein
MIFSYAYSAAVMADDARTPGTPVVIRRRPSRLVDWTLDPEAAEEALRANNLADAATPSSAKRRPEAERLVLTARSIDSRNRTWEAAIGGHDVHSLASGGGDAGGRSVQRSISQSSQDGKEYVCIYRFELFTRPSLYANETPRLVLSHLSHCLYFVQAEIYQYVSTYPARWI